MATLHLMVGLPCSGKTTEARRLERELGALRLTPDEWQTALFGDDAFEPEHDARHATVERLLWNIARRALELGVDVILDYGFWAREERDALRAQARALGCACRVHFMDAPLEELIARVAVRNRLSGREPVFTIAPEQLREWAASFEAPDEDELGL